MRKSAPVAVLVVIALLVGAAAWSWIAHDSPELVGSSRTESQDARGNAPATSTAVDGASPSRLAEVAPPATERTGRYGVRGKVVLARDGSAAAGARVRAFARLPPLARVQADRRDRSSNLEPAAAHDVSDLIDAVFSDESGDDSGDDSKATASEGDDHSDSAEPALAETTADAAGLFELLGLEPKSFQVDAVLPLAVTAEPIRVAFEEPGEPPIREGVTLRLVDGARIVGHVRTSDGRPVAAAEVSLRTPFDPFSAFAAGGLDLRSPASARTADDGAFAFLGVPAPLDLKAKASAKGFADSPLASVASRVGATSVAELVVATGGAIVVKVVDEGGAPLAGARCRCDPGRLDLRDLAFQAQAFRGNGISSDEGGVARFEGLGPGSWAVTADVADRLPASRTVELADGVSSLDVELRVEAGRELRGTVHSKDGTVITGARLTAYLEPSLGNLTTMIRRTGRRSATSGEDGSFVVHGLPVGKLLVEARAPGYQAATTKAEAGGNPIDVVLASRGVLEGIVVSRKTTKAVTRFDLKLARKREGSVLVAFDPQVLASLNDVTLPFSTQNGKFRIAGVNPGTLRLVARAAGHGEQATDWLDLAEGETRKGIVIYLEPEAAIEGRVVDAATAAPIAGAKVRRDVGGGSLLENAIAQYSAVADATSDHDGHFRIDGLAAGAHHLVGSAEGYVDASVPELQVVAGQTLSQVQVELERGGEIFGAVVGPDASPLAGATVFCQEMTRFKMRSVKSDAKGDYRIGGLAAGSYTLTRMPESFDLSGENFMADMTSTIEARSVRLKPGELLRVDFGGAQEGRASLEGTVRQAGKPLRDAVINVFVQSPGAETASGGMRSATSAADGMFRIDRMKAGPAYVQVSQVDFGMAGGQSAAIATVTLRDGETTHVELDIPGGGITGVVVDAASGEPLAGVAVYATGADEAGESMLELAMRRAAAARTDASGAFHLHNLRGGSHCVVAGGSDVLAGGGTRHAIVKSGALLVPDGASVDVGTLRLPAGARIEGIVTDADGRPLAGASLFLRDPATGAYLEEWTAASSSDSGTFEYDGVPAGTWDVVCRAPGRAVAVVRGVRASEGGAATVRIKLLGGTEVFADIGTVDFDKLVDLWLEVEGPEGRVPLSLFGLGDLPDLLSRPWQPDVVRLGRFGPGDYRVLGRIGGKSFEKKFTLAGEPELHVPVSLP